MRKYIFHSTLAMLILSALFGAGQLARTADKTISNGPSGQQVNRRVTTQELFVRALSAARVPGGFVWMMKCRGEEPRFPDDGVIPALDEALGLITRLDARYKSRVENGVVNLLPAKGEPPLLKVRLKQFKVNADFNRALDQLLALGEVKEGAARLGLKRNTMTLLVGPSPIGSRTSTIELDLRDVSLREALNALARAHGRAVWQYREDRCQGAKEFSVEFLAR
jgi:hypothetical protein